MLLARLDNLGNLLLAIATDDNLRNLAIETSISTPAEGTQLVGINTVRGQELLEL
jgi:hypothetical protein